MFYNFVFKFFVCLFWEHRKTNPRACVSDCVYCTDAHWPVLFDILLSTSIDWGHLICWLCWHCVSRFFFWTSSLGCRYLGTWVINWKFICLNYTHHRRTYFFWAGLCWSSYFWKGIFVLFCFYPAYLFYHWYYSFQFNTTNFAILNYTLKAKFHCITETYSLKQVFYYNILYYRTCFRNYWFLTQYDVVNLIWKGNSARKLTDNF